MVLNRPLQHLIPLEANANVHCLKAADSTQAQLLVSSEPQAPVATYARDRPRKNAALIGDLIRKGTCKSILYIYQMLCLAEAFCIS